MRRTALAESGQVVLEALLVGVDALGTHRRFQLLDVMDTLGARHDLLTAHEEVVRIGEPGVLRAGLGVEGPHGHGELVQHEEVGVVLLADDLAKLLLHGGGEVIFHSFLLRDIDAGFFQQGDTVHVVQPQRLAVFRKFEVSGLGVGLLDDGDLVLVPLLELGQDKDKEILAELEDLVVVGSESLLEIKTGELISISNGYNM